MSGFSFLNPILTPAARTAIAADPSIVTTLGIVTFALQVFAGLSWYIGFATGKAKVLREEAKKAKKEKKEKKAAGDGKK